MNKITFEDFCRIMSYDVESSQSCIEIEFYIDNCKEYQCSWLGKMLDNKEGKAVYWFGLTEDGLQAYEFESLEQFITAKVFHGKNMKEIWKDVSIRAIDACNVEERLPFYLKEK